MTTKEFYRTQGNEVLKPLAIGLDRVAVEVLEERGNRLFGGKLVKVRVTERSERSGNGWVHIKEETTVTDGKVTDRKLLSVTRSARVEVVEEVDIGGDGPVDVGGDGGSPGV